MGASRVTLIELTTATPSALTLRCADDAFVDPNGAYWEPFIGKFGGIAARGRFADCVTEPVTASFSLIQRDPQVSTSDIAALFAAYSWSGASVSIYLWERSIPYDFGYTSFAVDRCTVFTGIVSAYTAGIGSIDVRCQQDMGWNVEIPNKTFDKATYPDAPDSLYGQPLPWVYGDFRMIPLASPWPSSSAFADEASCAGMARLAVPALVTDKGTQGTVPKVLIAGHACTTITDAMLEGGAG